jgi:hypothetical protein
MGFAVSILVAIAVEGCGSEPPTNNATDATEVDAPETDAAADAAVTDAATDAAADARVDAPTDAATDAWPYACDPFQPVGAQGCGPGWKCSWVQTQETPVPLGQLGCVPDGAVALGEACVHGPPGPSTGYDDCAAGGICINAVCSDICGFDGTADTSCAVGYNCARYAGVFQNGPDEYFAGACQLGCDPLTQLRTDGTSCGVNQGCYILSDATATITVCAGAGTTAVGGEIVGMAYANSCVPGAEPRRKDDTTSTMECGGLCRPTDVTSSMTQDEGGVEPDSCQTRWSAAAPADPLGESCRYWWGREMTPNPSPLGNSVGWCFRHNAHRYDSDGDHVVDRPTPRCVTLTTGDVEPPVTNPPGNDALSFLCIAAPLSLARTATSAMTPTTPEARLDVLAPR